MLVEERSKKSVAAVKRSPFWNIALIGTLTWITVSSEALADRLVLRNLKIISNQNVVSFNEDGVKLDGGTTVTWDEIERGSLSAKQDEFNKMLKDLGGPLFQIRQRLTKGDYRGLTEPAEAVYARYLGRDSKTAYMVFQSMMWSRMANGRREAAVEPYLRCFEYLKAHQGNADGLPGTRRLKYNADTAISDELLPIWFDAKAAREALPTTFQAVRDMKRPQPPGARIFYGTLALTAGETETGTRILAGVNSDDRTVIELRDITLAQQDAIQGQRSTRLAQLEASLEKLSAQNKPLALYWLGVQKTLEDDERIQSRGVLQLLYLPALYGEKYPELAGAGLYRAMKVMAQLNNPQGSVKLRRELLVRYGQTVHAAIVKSGADSTKNSER